MLQYGNAVVCADGNLSTATHRNADAVDYERTFSKMLLKYILLLRVVWMVSQYIKNNLITHQVATLPLQFLN